MYDLAYQYDMCEHSLEEIREMLADEGSDEIEVDDDPEVEANA